MDPLIVTGLHRTHGQIHKKFFTHPTAKMSKVSPKERKQLLFTHTKDYFTHYTQFIVVGLNNVTSSQLQSAKQAWQGKAEFLFGKNTTIKKALRDMGHEDIASRIFGNVAFIFTNGDVREIKQIVEDNKRNTFAKVGAIAQTDVWIEKKVTNMGPDKTSFFQALGISTKITKGKVEIIQNSKALTEGEKVTPSQANLLAIMDIQPFVYAMKLESIYGDKQFYEPWIADITDKDVESSLVEMAQRVTACALGMGTIVKTTVPFDTKNALRKVVALSLAIGYDVDLAKPFK